MSNMSHTADPHSQPGLAYLCDLVCRLKVGECLRVNREEIIALGIKPSYSIGGSPYDRVASNIIGSAYEISVTEYPTHANFCRHENNGQRTYTDPDRR